MGGIEMNELGEESFFTPRGPTRHIDPDYLTHLLLTGHVEEPPQESWPSHADTIEDTRDEIARFSATGQGGEAA